jgi:hypothetical protein
MPLVILLSWKVDHRRRLSVPELVDAFKMYELRIEYWVANQILAQRRGEDVSPIEMRLRWIERDVDFLFSERSRLEALGQWVRPPS